MPVAAERSIPAASHFPSRLLTEAALGRRVAAGDQRAFAELFRRHQQALYGFCVSILRNPEDAADALQNTMAKAIQSLPGEDRELSLKPWLFRVAHNECIDMLRARRPNEDIEDHELPAIEGVEGSVVTRERLRQLLADLDHLPDRQRGALVMRELNGLDFTEVGSALDTTPSAAKQLVYEARCALQEQNEGRDMDCETVRRAVSERDGRVLAARRIRAHLRECEGCRDFQRGIEVRRADLRLLVPPIPAALALSIAEMFGGPGGGGGLAAALGLGGGKAALSGGAMKAVAVVAVSAGVGAGTVGVIEGQREARDTESEKVVEASSSPPGSAPVPAPSVSGDGGAANVKEGPGARRADGEARLIRRPGAKRRGDSGGPGLPGRRNPGQPGGRPAAIPPGTPPASNPGGSGGAQHKGAVPDPGGRPAALPEAAAKGQAQAEAHANPNSTTTGPPAGTGRPEGAGRPADPGASAPPGGGSSKKVSK